MQQHGTYLQRTQPLASPPPPFFCLYFPLFFLFGLLFVFSVFFWSVFGSVYVLFFFLFVFLFRLGVVGMRGASTGFHDLCALVAPFGRALRLGVAARGTATSAAARKARSQFG